MALYLALHSWRDVKSSNDAHELSHCLDTAQPIETRANVSLATVSELALNEMSHSHENQESRKVLGEKKPFTVHFQMSLKSAKIKLNRLIKSQHATITIERANQTKAVLPHIWPCGRS